MKLNADFRFTLMTMSHCCSLMRIISPSRVMPALLTSTSIRPKSLTIWATTAAVSSKSAAFRRVSLSLNAEGLQLLFGVLKVLVDFQIGENDRGAFLRETQRNRLADAAGGSGYDGDFSFK